MNARIPILMALLALVGCGGSQPAAQAEQPTPTTKVAPDAKPSAPAPAPEPADVGPADLASGKDVYDTYCKACHQEDGSGMNGMLAANFKEEGRLDKTDAQLLGSIRDGFKGKVGQMPPWKGTLSEQQMVDVLAHVRNTYGEE